MRVITHPCDECDSIATVTLPDSGGGWVSIDCPKCGHYAELVGEEEIEAALKEREEASR